MVINSSTGSIRLTKRELTTLQNASDILRTLAKHGTGSIQAAADSSSKQIVEMLPKLSDVQKMLPLTV